MHAAKTLYQNAIKAFIDFTKNQNSSVASNKLMRHMDMECATSAFDSKRPIIYAILFPAGGRRSKVYIGETTRPWKRFTEHLRAAGSYVRKEIKGTNPLYRYWAGRGLTSALMIPLRWAPMDEATRLRSETHTIFSFPGTLNTEYIHRAWAGDTRKHTNHRQHRTRHRCHSAAYMHVTEQMFTAGNLTSGCLDVMLEKLKSGTTVGITEGSRHLTDMKALCTVYGNSSIELLTTQGKVEGTIRDMRNNIRLAPTGAQMRLVRLVCSVTTRLAAQEDALYDLRLITRDGSAYTALSRAGVEPQRMTNIINARGLLARIVSPSLMEVADRRVSHLCKLTFGMSLPRNLVLKAQMHHNVHRGRLLHAAKYILNKSQAPQAVIAFTLPHLRVVSTKQPSLLDVLSGHRKFARHMAVDNPPTCRCKNLPAAFGRINGHVICLGKDLARCGAIKNPDLTTTLSTAAKDVVHPEGDIGIRQDVRQALRDFTAELQKRGIQADITEGEIFQLAENAITAGAVPVPEGGITMRQANHTRRWMQTRGLVACEVDKNKGEIAWMCERSLHEANTALFSPSSPNYEAAALTSDEELAGYRAAFQDAQIGPAKWNTAGTFPRAYCMPKYKSFLKGYDEHTGPDNAQGQGRPPEGNRRVNCRAAGRRVKYRPIVADVSSPTRCAKNECGRALMFMLERTEARGAIKTMRMANCTDLADHLRRANIQLLRPENFPRDNLGEHVAADSLRVRLVTHDVSQLYTSLPHAVVRDAVKWLSAKYTTLVRQSHPKIAVPIRGRQLKRQIHGGRSHNPEVSRTWTVESILSMVDVILRFIFFKLGDELLRQTSGIAMGCPASGALALVTLAHMEATSYERIPPTLLPRLCGWRIMDDLAQAVVYIQDDAQSTAEAEALLSAMQYHSSLVLEQTSDPTVEYTRYLEGELFTPDHRSLDCRFYNPNAVSLGMNLDTVSPPTHELHCEKLRFRSWTSYGPTSVKRHVIHGFFRRMQGYSLDVERTQTDAGAQLVTELIHCKYPASFLRNLITTAPDSVICPRARQHLLTMDALSSH